MKKDLIYSLLLHILILILAIWIVRSRNVTAPKPFVATIVTPEELQQEEKRPASPPPPREKEPSRMPRLPKDLPPPEKFSAMPSAPARKSIPAEHPEEKTAAGRQGGPPAGSSEPSQAGNEHLLPQEKEGPSGNKEPGDSFRQSGRSYPGMTTRQKLFDRDVIARAVTKGNERPDKDAGITFDTTEYKYYGYMQRLREKIEGIWKYPSEAQQRKLNGDLYIRFTIRKDGSLETVELVHTSGYKILDDAAIRALRDANPYWPLPDSWHQDSLTITGKFVYYFYNTYIR